MMNNITKAKKTLSLTLPKIGRSLSLESSDVKSKVKSGLSREFAESKVVISKMTLLDFVDPDDLQYYKNVEKNNITFIEGIRDSLKVNNRMIQQNDELKETIRVKDALFLSFLASMQPLVQMLIDKLSNITMLPGPGAPAGTGEILQPTGVSYDPGQPGLDITFADNQNKALYPGVVVKIGHQYTPNATGGDGRKGAGYGNYIIIRSNNPITNGQMDVLYAHFPDGELGKFKEGDNIGRGQLLGRMATAEEFANPRTRPRVGSGTGPHMSIDFYQADSNIPASEIEKVRQYTDEQLRTGGFERMRKREQPQPPSSNGIVIAIGANDYNTDPDTIKRNVKSIIEKARRQGFTNVIIIPPSENAPYTAASKAVQEAARESGATIEKGQYKSTGDNPRPYTHLTASESQRIRKKYPNAVVIGDSNAEAIAGSQVPNIRFRGATSDQINKNIAKNILSQLLDKN